MTSSTKRTFTTILIVLAVIAGLGGWFIWYEFFREEPEAEWQAENGHSAEDIRFMYGSIGGEHDAGIPYWIVYVLPRIFPDKLPASGGYASFGIAWDQGRDLPIGFTTKVIGFKRVAQNCAVCHTASYRAKPDELPTFVPTGPAHTFNLEAFFRFLVDCAKDPRFNADTLMAEINQSKPKDFTFVDGLIYRYILIPVTKKRLLERETRFAWIYQHNPPERWPDWGRGRDDAMNLTKYFLTTSPMDDTLGPTDMPAIWNLKKYSSGEVAKNAVDSCGPNLPKARMNLAGDSCNANSVIIDSALGLLGKAPPSNHMFLQQIKWLETYLGDYPAPKYPFPIDPAKAAAGKAVFDAQCAMCHWSERTGTVMPVEQIGTDRERIDSWNKDAAIRANNAVKSFGIVRRGLVEAKPYGYVISFLDGIWLRAPYLHNGSVPSLRDLLKPVAERPKVFYRGYDVYDPEDVGFVSQKVQADRLKFSWDDVLRVATKYEVCVATKDDVCVRINGMEIPVRSNGNAGHEFGTDLPQDKKDALIEYLKTL